MPLNIHLDIICLWGLISYLPTCDFCCEKENLGLVAIEWVSEQGGSSCQAGTDSAIDGTAQDSQVAMQSLL